MFRGSAHCRGSLPIVWGDVGCSYRHRRCHCCSQECWALQARIAFPPSTPSPNSSLFQVLLGDVHKLHGTQSTLKRIFDAALSMGFTQKELARWVGSMCLCISTSTRWQSAPAWGWGCGYTATLPWPVCVGESTNAGVWTHRWHAEHRGRAGPCTQGSEGRVDPFPPPPHPCSICIRHPMFMEIGFHRLDTQRKMQFMREELGVDLVEAMRKNPSVFRFSLLRITSRSIFARVGHGDRGRDAAFQPWKELDGGKEGSPILGVKDVLHPARVRATFELCHIAGSGLPMALLSAGEESDASAREDLRDSCPSGHDAEQVSGENGCHSRGV